MMENYPQFTMLCYGILFLIAVMGVGALVCFLGARPDPYEEEMTQEEFETATKVSLLALREAADKRKRGEISDDRYVELFDNYMEQERKRADFGDGSIGGG